MDTQIPMIFNGDSPLHVAVRQGQIENVRTILVQQQVDVNILNSKHETPLHLACSRRDSAIVQLLIAFGADPFIKDSNNNTTNDRSSPDITTLMNKLLFHHGLWINRPTQTDGDSPLHAAVRLGMLGNLKRVLTEQAVNVDEINASHETPLHVACALGLKHIVYVLISKGADMFIRDCYNNAPIHRAVSQGHKDIFDCLIMDYGCDPKIRGYQGRTLLHFACGIGNAELAVTLIEKYGISPLATDAVNQTPLHIAASHGQEEIVCILITKYNTPVDSRSNYNLSPLHLASYCGYVSLVKTLVLEYKADMNAFDKAESTPFLKAVMGGNLDLILLMITNLGLDPLLATDGDGDTSLHYACQCGHTELARLLITEYNCPVDVRNKINEVPLHNACWLGKVDIVRMLVSEFKADTDARDIQKNIPLNKAALGGHADIVQMLIIELGCNSQVKGFEGRSLLHQACDKGHTNLAIMLITDLKLDPHLADDRGNTPLHMACLGDHEELARLLITKYNCPVDIRNKNNETPLHKASSFGSLNVVRMLVSEFKADNHTRNYQDDTPLSVAVLNDHTDIVLMLITEFGCSPQIKGFEGRSLLHQACDKGHTNLAIMLITDLKLDPHLADDSGNTPLHMACWFGHEKLARLLITKYNCPVDIKNNIKETPLHKACLSGHLSTVRMLVSEFKADTSLRDQQNDTAISLAAGGGHAEIVLTLITELGCSPKITGYGGRSLLHEACHSGSIKLAEVLITDFNLDVLSTNDSKNTPLHMACSGGHEELARLLITNYNCPVYIRNKNNETPLHKACLFGSFNVVRMLVSEFKANNDTRNYQDETPLSVAVLNGHTDIVLMLITVFGCSPQVKGFEGRSLLHHACDKGHTNLAIMLITDLKLDPLLADNNGNTPLHMACSGGHEELARLLITKYNCPADVKNKYNQTPLHMACSCGHLGVSKLLISKYTLGSSRDKWFSTDYNTLDMNGNTPLDLLIKSGNAKAVHILSTVYGCKPHVKGAESKPLLHQLAAGGYATMLKELISNFNHDPASVDEDGNVLLHSAVQHERLRIIEFLITNHRNHFPIDCRNFRGQTALHYACIGGHTEAAKLLVANKANMTIRDEDGDTPLKKAFLTNHTNTLFELFNSNLCTINPELLHQVCECGSADLVDILLSDSNLDAASILDNQGNQALHIAVTHYHNEIIALLINKYKCPVDSRNFKEQTPLHLLCSQTPTEGVTVLIKQFITEFKADVNSRDKYGQTPLHLLCRQTSTATVDAIIKMFITEFSADVSSRNRKGDQPIHAAAQAGCTNTVINLIINYGCSSDSRGFKKRTLLHHALAMGHTSTAKTLILNNLSLHCIDDDGNTPLHLSSLYGQPRSVRFLLYDYHAPIHVRNKAGKTALDLAKNDSAKKVIREYMGCKHKSIQQEYEELRARSLQKYSGEQIITRVFVLGNPGSGKSTLVEALKRKGILYSFFTITEADVPPHTAGIVPSVYQSKEAGRLLYYDFAGDKEYFSSHAAILEIVSHLNVGSNVYFIIADSRKDDMTINNEIGYWLSFISYHGKALLSQCRMKIIIILSHSDHLSLTDSDGKRESMRRYLQAHINQYDKIFDIVEVVSSNCCSPRSSRSIEAILQRISKDTPPCSISYETSLLHGMLEKDFSNVVACKFQDLLSNIKETGICLPTVPSALYPIVKELHDIGLLMMIGRSEDKLEDYLLLLDLSSLTHEVHQLFFSSSESVIQNFNSSTGPHYYADMGILPENYLVSVLPEHITKECLVQLQYCQEFSCAEVGLDSSAVSSSASESNLLYFPALCKLDSEQSNWLTDPQLNFSIGWYAKCTGKLDYFPARFLHVLLLRLAFAFALPIANCNITKSNEISAHNRRCTMWKKGIRWLMEEGVECIFEMVSDNKGIVVITKSKKNSKEWANILIKIIDKVMQAKAEFCSPISLHHFLLKPENTSSFKNNDNLFEITEVEKVIREGKEMVVSVSGRAFLESSHLFMFRKYTFWGLNFPMNISTILRYIRGIVEEWEHLGMALQVPIEILREIDIDRSLVASKKEEMIMKWMDSPAPACWWLLVKALEEIDQNVAAAAILTEQGEIIEIQRKLIEGGEQKPDDVFLQSFAPVVGDRWLSLASLLSITAREIEEIRREEKEQQALCMLMKWSTKEEATFERLHQKLQTVYLFRC